jgi:hypothetical protein
MKTFTNTSARRTSSPPSTELPGALENHSVDRLPRIGQAISGNAEKSCIS